MNLNLLKKRLIDKFPYLNKWLSFNYGFQPEELKDTDYVLGASPLFKKVLQPDMDWTPYLPTGERQSGRNIETFSCVSQSFLNVLETLFKRKYNIDINFSDRFLAKVSGTTQNGNLQSRVADAARKVGLVLENDYTADIDEVGWSEYYKPLTSDLFLKARTFLEEWEIGYEAIPPTLLAMREGLKYSPLWAAGYAWAFSNGSYYSAGSPNHAFMPFNMNPIVVNRLIFDSYDPFTKKLASDYQLYYPKILTLNRKGEQYNIGEIINLIKAGFKYIMRTGVGGHGEIYELSNTGLKYISAQDWNNINVQLSSDKKILKGVNEEYFASLII